MRLTPGGSCHDELAISEWKPHSAGTLLGFIKVTMPSGLVLHEPMLHRRGDTFWLNFPSKPMVGADGTALRDERGKVRYGPPLLGFASRHDRDRFTEQVLAALCQAQPQLFAAERAGMSSSRLATHQEEHDANRCRNTVWMWTI